MAITGQLPASALNFYTHLQARQPDNLSNVAIASIIT